MGIGIDMPLVGGRDSIGRGVHIDWVGGSICHR